MHLEHTLPDETRSDCVLCHRQGRPPTALEAKRASTNPVEARAEGCHYAKQIEAPFVFIANGEVVRFRDRESDAYTRKRVPARSQASTRMTT